MKTDWKATHALAGVALLVGAGYLLRAAIRELVVRGIERSGTLPWWLPEFGTNGETVIAYLLFASLISYVAVPFLAFALGYRSGKGATG